MDQSFDPESQLGTASADQAQRGAARDSTFLNAQVRRVGGGSTLTLRVRNLSPGGMMVETDARFARGDAVVVTIRNIGDVPGRVAWLSDGRVGIAFDVTVDPREARKAPPQSPGSTMMLVKAATESKRPGLRADRP